MPVKGRELTKEHPLGPAVRNDVVQVDRQDVLVVVESQQKDSCQRSSGQIERPGLVLAYPLFGLSSTESARQAGQVDAR